MGRDEHMAVTDGEEDIMVGGEGYEVERLVLGTMQTQADTLRNGLGPTEPNHLSRRL